jgi:hypothetical protein
MSSWCRVLSYVSSMMHLINMQHRYTDTFSLNIYNINFEQTLQWNCHWGLSRYI